MNIWIFLRYSAIQNILEIQNRWINSAVTHRPIRTLQIEYLCFLSDVADDSDFSAFNFDGDGWEYQAVDSRVLGSVNIGCYHRESGVLDVRHQTGHAVIKLVIA